jgi:hypothetical protein
MVPGKLCPVAKEQFFYWATKPLFNKLEQLSQRSGVSRGQAFEDWLTAMVCALAAETKEDEYLAMIDRHKRGEMGQRGADLMPQMFAERAPENCVSVSNPHQRVTSGLKIFAERNNSARQHLTDSS